MDAARIQIARSPAKACAAFVLTALGLFGATFGRVVPLVGGASDLVIDEARGRLYLTSPLQNVVQVYGLQQNRILTSVQVDASPIAAALSRDGRFLYVTCYESSAIDVIDLDLQAVSSRVGLPARPEGIAVGSDGRVLITTTGNGTNGQSNLVVLYDPAPDAAVVLRVLPAFPPAPVAPVFPPPSSRPFLSARSQLVATHDGAHIAGVNLNAAGVATVFVYETASNSILRSRTAVGSSLVLSISDDGSRVMSGVNLFDAQTMQVLAQQNVATSAYPMDPTSNFGLLANQGGHAFAPDGQTLYSIYNLPPFGGGGGAVSQMAMNDPDNLLARMGIQLPEGIAGKMVVASDGANAYALSDSGFLILPLSTIFRSPLAVPASNVVLVTRDACGVFGQNVSVTLNVNNPGQGRVTANAQFLQFPGVGQATAANAPSVRSVQAAAGPQLVFTHNAAVRGSGSAAPPHDFAVTAPEAINIPDRVRVFQNSRDPDSRGTIVPIAASQSAAAAPSDLVYDPTRQRVYVTNPGFNRVEVYDIRQQRLLNPVKVGQLPISMAITADASTLYVSNSGGESISIVNLDLLQATGRVAFPPLSFNANVPIVTPGVIATSLAGPQVLMNNGALWKIVNNAATPRGVSKEIGQTPAGAPVPIPQPSSMASSPGGDYILLATGTGFAYLYDASVDDFTAGRQVSATPPAGYVGPIAAGPRGQFFVVNGTLLNSSLVPGRAGVGLISALTAFGNNSYALYSPPPAAAGANPTLVAPTVQILDGTTGNPMLAAPALESPLVQVGGAARAIIGGRTMAIDASGATAYVLTVSGLSVIPLAPVPPADRPLPNPRGVVNLASYQPQVAPNGLLSIFGQNLAAPDMSSSLPLPIVLGGTCVTLNNIALPLFYATPQQINAQIPPNLAPGTYPLVVRNINKQAASATQQITVSQYAPAVLVSASGQIMLFHEDGTFVNNDNPANRDEPLTMYAVGLGATKGGAVGAGTPSPSNPLAVTNPIQVFFGDPRYKQAAVIVDWSGLVPGYVGLYQLNLRVPGFHMSGEQLPVTLRLGTVNSPVTGPVVPYVAVD